MSKHLCSLQFLRNVLVPEHKGVLLHVEPERVCLSYIIHMHSRKLNKAMLYSAQIITVPHLTTGSEHAEF